MNKGERIWKSLLDPSRHCIMATEWLLLYVLSKRRRTEVQKNEIQNIQQELGRIWQKINTICPSFYLTFPDRLDLEKELLRFCEIGLCDDQLSLTARGRKVLNDWQPLIEKDE